LLTVTDLDVFYDDIQVLHGVTLEVGPGEIVALVGANGAGKTTLLRAISGLLRPRGGSIEFRETRLNQLAPHRIVEAGVVHVPEGRRLFPDMTVLENLELGAVLPRAKAVRRATLESVLNLFPRLAERKNQKAGTLSGGEQQMLALGRALMSKPRLLLLDEPSQGLAPMVVEQIFLAVELVNREQGTPILMVEQNVTRTLKTAHRGYVIENGRIVLQGASAELSSNAEVKKAYLGL
jgi:branched-chain amino acid transport system ATP-binding protein